MIKRGWIIGGVIAGILAVPITYFLVQYKKLMDYEINPDTITRISKEGRRYKYRVVFNFENKSSLGYTIEQQSYEVFLGNLKIGEGSYKENVEIKPKSVSKLPMVMEFVLPTNAQAIGYLLELFSSGKVLINVKWQVSLMGLKTNIEKQMEFKI
jgi:hypothetical protein